MAELPEDVREHRDWLLSFVEVPQPATVVDIGCGDGDDLIALAARYRHLGMQFVGIDAGEKSILTAAAQAKNDPRISFRQEKIEGGLPFADGTVDGVYSHNFLECLADGNIFAKEVGRVLRPGGVVVIAHWDFDSQLFDATDKELARRLVHTFADWQQPWMEHADGWMGRRLWGTFAPTKLFAGTVQARLLVNTTYSAPWYGHARAQGFERMARRGLVPAADVKRFTTDLEALAKRGRYFYSIVGFAYVGRRLATK